MMTPRQFNAPIKIELRAKMNKPHYFFRCGEEIFVNLFEKETKIFQKTNGGHELHAHKTEALPADEFMDIEWVLAKEFAAIRLNGELWHYSNDYGYIKALKENPEYSLGAVYVGGGEGSTLTVQSLRVTEI
jgi:hypothetical protein